MVAGTIITVASIPVYWALYHALGPMGLAVASDVGILMQTTALAVLLHRRSMVSLAGLEYPELGRALLAALVSFAALAGLRQLVHTTSRLHELGLLAVAAILWIGVCALVLRLTGSSLPGQLTRRFAKAA